MDAEAVRYVLSDVGRFSHAVWPERALRRYQLPAARAIACGALHGGGGSVAVVFARQAGKDELLAQVIAFLLIHRQRRGGEIVVAAPSLVPQGQVTMRRVAERLEAAAPFVGTMHEEEGALLHVGRASARFMSAGEGAQARGATASLLLVGNEAQDIVIDRWDAVFEPMGASTDSLSVFMGTVWTNDTLLAREMVTAERAGSLYTADYRAVGAEVPAYLARVKRRIAALGADHPFVKTEYRLLPLDGDGLLFDAGRQAQMRGTHARIHVAEAGRQYVLLLDVAGEEEEHAPGIHAAADRRRDRDSTVLTVVELGQPATVIPGEKPLPVYRVVDRRIWTGANHVTLAGEVVDLARRTWRAARVVVDATGIGHGLSAMLRGALGDAFVVPFVFTSASKSDLGWRLLAAIGAGRFQDYADDGAADTRLFWEQVRACQFSVRPGPGRLMEWSVPESQGHDDLLLSAALIGAVDDLDLRPRLAVGH